MTSKSVPSRAPRRSRAVQACTSCRKNKARCELLEDIRTIEILRCHRCKTLKLKCSYQDADRKTLRLGRRTGISQAWEQLVDLADGTSMLTPTIRTSNSSPQSVNGESRVGQASLDINVLPQAIWKYKRISHNQWRYAGDGTDDSDRYPWSTPMVASHEISAAYHAQMYGWPHENLKRKDRESLNEILNQSQMDELLRLFHEQYLPWLGFSIVQCDKFPLLDLVCCTIASRHLSRSPLSVLADRLLYATEHAISQIILYPPPAYVLESIQALVLISIWAPIPMFNSSPPQEGWRDSHLLLSSAVSLATKIGLDQAPERYSHLRKMREQGMEVDEKQFKDAANLARLWVSLTNAESLSCIGTSRTSFSHRGSAYLECFSCSMTESISNDSAEAKDIRLRIFADTLSATEVGLASQIDSIDDFEIWHHQVSDSLQRIDSCGRILLPLGVVLDFDQVYFRTQRLVSQCCRLLVFWDIIQTGRMLSIKGRHNSRSHSNVFTDVFTPWGRDSFELSEEIFVSLLDLLEKTEHNLTRNASASDDTSPVSASSIYTAPDHLFNLLEVAGILLVAFKFTIHHTQKINLLRSSDVLLERVIVHFRKLEAPREHPAAKCADLFAGLLSLWRDRENIMAPQAAGKEEFCNEQMGNYQADESINSILATPTHEILTNTTDIPAQSDTDMPTFDISATGDIDINAWFNSAVFQDDQLWQNVFMQQLPSGHDSNGMGTHSGLDS
ncbi:hypothetical protein BDP27DRAFT_499018 [Rhodocollybia butyracea]|uniref:Zn(2)-C6 fungal-type domain-containing protein n=1 Tax=Rhodocollybia butyracea TaxID=206335 RepID=A0A9P5PYG9_9AGAR|nr:hypothetical protein BDP27DRAFT_499018 [Rhodocollybia butyracea]